MKQNYFLIFCFLFSFGLQAQNYKFGKVSKEEVLEKEHKIDKEANAAILYKEQKVYYEWYEKTGFTVVTEIHERIKIYNKEGLEWATREIHYSQTPGNNKEEIVGIKGYTYSMQGSKVEKTKLNKDGIFDEEVNDYQLKTTLTMPAATVGSVIEITYSIRSPFLRYIDDVVLQHSIPLNKLEVKVVIPEFYNFKKYANPKAPVQIPVTEVSKRRTYDRFVLRGSEQVNDKIFFMENEYLVSAEDVPALKKEAHVDYLYNYAAFLKWELQSVKSPNSVRENFAITWEGVTTTVFNEDGIGEELNSSNYFKSDLDALLATTSEDSAEKAAAIFSFVKSKVKWNNYYGYRARRTCKSAYANAEGNVGEINLMLTAMLRYAGFDANPVLVSSPSNGTPLFPTRKGFNYLIASVEMPEGTVLMDATDPYAAPGELPERARNWQGRLIKDKDNSFWVNLRPGTQSQTTTSMNVKFNDDFTLSGKSRTISQGFFAKQHREKFLGLKEDKYLDHLEQNHQNFTVSNFSREGEENLGQPINEAYDFEMDEAIDVINDKIYFQPLLFLAMKENPFKETQRQYPIFFEYPSVTNNVVNIMLPAGYKVEFLPESSITEIDGGALTYKFLINQNGNFLRIESVIDMKNTIYGVGHYEALKKFYAEMIEKQNQSIILQKT